MLLSHRLPRHLPAQTLTVPLPQMTCDTCAALQHHACRIHSAAANCWVEKLWAPSRCSSCIRFVSLAHNQPGSAAEGQWASFACFLKQRESKKVRTFAFLLFCLCFM